MPSSVLIALGSNLGDRVWMLRRAIAELTQEIDVVRISSFVETEPVDAPAGSPRFLNAVVAGCTERPARALLDSLLRIEHRLGRRRTVRNAPRFIDLDLILYSAQVARSKTLTLPHPRYLQREFVLGPMRELGLGWRDPASGVWLSNPVGAIDPSPGLQSWDAAREPAESRRDD